MMEPQPHDQPGAAPAVPLTPATPATPDANDPWGSELGEAPPDYLAEAGTLVDAVTSAALAFATQDLVPLDSLVWWPAPVPAPGGATLACICSLYESDAEVQDYVVHEPEAVVSIDPRTLAAVGHERWRPDDAPTPPAPLAYWLPDAVRALPEHDRDALAHELKLLYERVLPLVGLTGLAGDERDTAVRFARLFRYLVPVELMPFYERAGPAFVDWLAALDGRPSPAPQPDSAIEPPARTFPALYELQAERYETLPETVWRLGDGALAAALQELELQPAAQSPLSGLDAAPDPAALAGELDALRALGMLEQWPAPAWRVALDALCRPAWAIAQIMGDAAGATVGCSYAGSGRDETLWVRYWMEDGANVIAYPDSPTLIKHAAAAVLRLEQEGEDGDDGAPDGDDGAPDGDDPVVHALSASSFRALVMQADPPPAEGAGSNPAADEDGGAAPAGWREIAAAISPIPFAGTAAETTPDQPPPAGGSVPGRVAGSNGKPAGSSGDQDAGHDSAALAGIDLGTPYSYAGVLVTEYQPDGQSVESGVALVRSSTGLWFWEAAEDWDAAGDAAGGDTPIHLVRITAESGWLVLDEFLGDDDPAFTPLPPDEADGADEADDGQRDAGRPNDE